MPILLKARRSREDGFDRGKIGWKAFRRAAQATLGMAVFLVQPPASITAVSESRPSYRGDSAHQPGIYFEEADRWSSVESAEAKLGSAQHYDDNSGVAGAVTSVDHDNTNDHGAAASNNCAADVVAAACSTDSNIGTPQSLPFTGRTYPGSLHPFTFRTLSEAHLHGLPDASDGLDTPSAAGAFLERCPFALEEDTPAAIAFWRRTLDQVAVALGPLNDPTPGRRPPRNHPRDASGESFFPTTRDLYDAIDALGTIFACCPGVLDPGISDTADESARDQDDRSPLVRLPTCGLLSVDAKKGTRRIVFPTRSDVGGGNPSPFLIGFELAMMYSRALRAARLPTQALRALHDAYPLRQTARQRSAWEAEAGAVLLQMGRVGDAAARLEAALGWDDRDLGTLQLLGAVLVARGSTAEGFRYLRKAVEVQTRRMAEVFGGVVKKQGLDPSLLEMKAHTREVLVTHRDWMALYLGLVLEGRWKELGDSVHVLRRVDNFLRRNVSMDSEIYRVRAALSIPAVPASREDLDLAMSSFESNIERLRRFSPTDGSRLESQSQGSPNKRGGFASPGEARPLSACSYGGLNYPEVVLDDLPLMAFANRWILPQQTANGVSPYAAVARLFSRLCPDLGGFVAPGLEAFAGGEGMAPREGKRPVSVVFVSSKFWNHGTTKTVAGLIRLLPRDFFQVTIASWPMPADGWTEHVLPRVDKRPVNLDQNRTKSFLRLAKRRPDVVVFVDASLDGKTFLLSFGRVAPVQIALWGHAPTLGIPSIDYYVVPEALASDAWPGAEETPTFDNKQGKHEKEDDAVCPLDSDLSLPIDVDYDYDYDEECTSFRDADEDERRDSEERSHAFGCPRGTFQKFSLSSADGHVGGATSKGPEEEMGGTGREFEAREGFPGGGGVGSGGRGRGCGCGCESCRRCYDRGGEQSGVGSCGDSFETDADGNVLLGCRHHRRPSVTGQGNLAEEVSGSTLLAPTAAEWSVGRGALNGDEGIHLVPVAEGVSAQQNFRDEGGSGENREGDYPRCQDGEGFDMMFGRLTETGADGDYDYDKGLAHEGRMMSPLTNNRAEGSRNVLRNGASRVEEKELEDHIRKFITGSGRVVIGGKTIRLDSGGDDAEEDDDDDDYDNHDLALPTTRPRMVPAGTPARKPSTISAEFSPGARRDYPPSSDNFPRNSCCDSDADDGCCCCGGVGGGSEDIHPLTRQQQYSRIDGGDDHDSTRSGVDDWPPPWAGVEYGDSVEEQVVLLEGLGAFVTPPGWEGRLGTGELARAADPAEVRRRHLLPQASRLAVLPIPVYHFHPEFDVAVGMLIDRHPLIHVVVAVEETPAEGFGKEGDLFRYDVTQHASPPLWTEKLRARLERHLGEEVWRVHLLPPLDSWDYFALLGAADVVLDPFPVGNLHAAVDAFALGTPVVTLPSRQRPGSRFVQALASDLELPASICAAADVERYVDLAARFCLDKAWAIEVAAVLDYYARDWVYIPHPDEEGGKQPKPSPPPSPDMDCDGSGKRDSSSWVRGEDHVNDWAEFLWRVSRPGVFLVFSED